MRARGVARPPARRPLRRQVAPRCGDRGIPSPRIRLQVLTSSARMRVPCSMDLEGRSHHSRGGRRGRRCPIGARRESLAAIPSRSGATIASHARPFLRYLAVEPDLRFPAVHSTPADGQPERPVSPTSPALSPVSPANPSNRLRNQASGPQPQPQSGASPGAAAVSGAPVATAGGVSAPETHSPRPETVPANNAFSTSAPSRGTTRPRTPGLPASATNPATSVSTDVPGSLRAQVSVRSRAWTFSDERSPCAAPVTGQPSRSTWVPSGPRPRSGPPPWCEAAPGADRTAWIRPRWPRKKYYNRKKRHRHNTIVLSHSGALVRAPRGGGTTNGLP